MGFVVITFGLFLCFVVVLGEIAPNGSLPCIQVHSELCDIIGADVFVFSHTGELESRSHRIVSKRRVQEYLLPHHVRAFLFFSIINAESLLNV